MSEEVRRLPFPEMLRMLREQGEPADPRPDLDTDGLKRRFGRLESVEVSAHDGPVPARLYRDPSRASGTALVWVHGGAFVGGHLDMPEAHWVSMELAARGIPVLSIDYTKCLGETHHPVPSDDVLAGWRDARSRSVELFGLPPEALALGGASAGGTLTSSAVVRLRDAAEPLPAGLALVYPVVHANGPEPGVPHTPGSTHEQIALNYSGGPEALSDPAAFAGEGSVAGFPPTLVVVCEHDELRPSGDRFAADLLAAGVAVELRMEADADHGHINEPADPTALRTIEAVARWLAGIPSPTALP